MASQAAFWRVLFESHVFSKALSWSGENQVYVSRHSLEISRMSKVEDSLGSYDQALEKQAAKDLKKRTWDIIS